MTRFGYTLTILIGASLGVAACTDNLDDGTTTQPPPGTTTGTEDTTFDHDNNQISVWELIDRLSKEGPPSFTSRMHPCTKPRYATLANILRSVGVNLANATALSAGQLYRDGDSAMGAPNYAARIRENINVTTSGASKEFDIFAAAADEIIAAVPTLARCQIGGVGTQLFTTATPPTCNAAGLTCLMGVPAETEHVLLCNVTITRATDPTTGKRLAVAALMAAAYTCE
jgi:hypothetical protein